MKFTGIFTALLLLVFAPFADAENEERKSSPTPPKTTITRGEISFIEEINMGPKATALWKNIQTLIATPDLRDFSSLQELFQLTGADSEEKIDLARKKFQIRIGSGGAGGLIEKWRYGIVIRNHEPLETSLILHITFDSKNVCISKMEIQRLYGEGQVTKPFDAPNWIFSDQTGYGHALTTYPHQAGFHIAPSGCALSFSTGQVFD